MTADPTPVLVPQEALPEPLRSMHIKHLTRLLKTGKLAPLRAVRLTPRSALMFDATSIADFIRRRIEAAQEGGL